MTMILIHEHGLEYCLHRICPRPAEVNVRPEECFLLPRSCSCRVQSTSCHPVNLSSVVFRPSSVFSPSAFIRWPGFRCRHLLKILTRMKHVCRSVREKASQCLIASRTWGVFIGIIPNAYWIVQTRTRPVCHCIQSTREIVSR
jgi:hypothetical protein